MNRGSQIFKCSWILLQSISKLALGARDVSRPTNRPIPTTVVSRLCNSLGVHWIPCIVSWQSFMLLTVTTAWYGEQSCIMMTSSNGNLFRVTGLLCGEFTGHPSFWRHCNDVAFSKHVRYQWDMIQAWPEIYIFFRLTPSQSFRGC